MPTAADSAILVQCKAGETIVIPDLPDGVFRDCASLRRVVFSHREAPCRVHPDTFQGTANLRVFVPDTDYVLYRDGVGCEANPWAEHLDRVFRYSLQDE